MKFMLGEKIGMTQIFDKNRNVVPVTLVRATDNTVLTARTTEKDGYSAVQVGWGERKIKNIKKPQQGHFKDLGNFMTVREFRVADADLKERGDKIAVSVFVEGDRVTVSGISKSKGFQGVVKRYGFHGAPATHGTKHAHRQPGSIGAVWPQRVVKGRRMAGRTGGVRKSILNLKIAKVDPENKILAISGAVPGRKGTLLEIRGNDLKP